jgi:ribonuclease P protein component
MLSRIERFTRVQFEAFLLKKDQNVVYNQLGTLKYIPGDKRLSVVVSSKHEKRAVIRNKIRRRIYNIFKKTPINISGILYLSKQGYLMDYKKTEELFNELLRKIKKNT